MENQGPSLITCIVERGCADKEFRNIDQFNSCYY